MKAFSFGKSKVSSTGPCYMIAEIGNNHQGDLNIAKQMIKVAASCGVQAVKFQKRDNKSLYTKAYYEKPYENENSYGVTYGEHREFLEFNKDEYRELMKCAEDNDVEFMCTAWDYESVEFLEDLGIASYKIASGDVTSTPLLEHIAKLGKPMFISTGAATLDEVRLAYDAVNKYNNEICLLHCVAGYPTEYHFLNLGAITLLKEEFPEAAIGFSGHDNGILAGVMAYMLGATVLEKHFTLNRSWKGTDHRFSLEPEGLRKQVRDLRRVDISRGDGNKSIQDFERDPRSKMGKGIYAAKPLAAGTIITMNDLALKSPTTTIPPYRIDEVIGKKLKVDLGEEAPVEFKDLQ